MNAQAPFRLEGIKNGLDNEAFAQQDLVGHRHEVVLHVAADASDKMQSALPEGLEQLMADIALIGIKLARQVLGHLVEHSIVGGVARGDLQRHDLALVVDNEVQLEAIKPPHAGLATCG